MVCTALMSVFFVSIVLCGCSLDTSVFRHSKALKEERRL